MEVVRARTAGFCMGVVLALQKLDQLLATEGGDRPIYTVGPIIHNPQVLDSYAARGVLRTDLPEEIPPGATAVIRAHGVPRPVTANLRRKGVAVLDATCPKVKKTQLMIGRQARKGRMLLLFGEESHPEVRGLLSYAESGAYLFDSLEKLRLFPLASGGRYCLAAQTTQDRERFADIAGALKSLRDCDIRVLQTICDATRDRQAEAMGIAREVDFMVVVGGFESGNTRRLAQVVREQGTPVVQVETALQLPLERIRSCRRVGLTAGASTPGKAIDEVQRILEGKGS